MSNPGILAGMRVVEATAFVAAPLGGMTLAQMGAEVIRIDALQGGIDYRRWPVTEANVSLFWCGLNKGKRSVALDINSPQGRELAMAIICAPGDDAGMLLTNFPPRGWLSHEALVARRSDLIQVTLQGDRHGKSAVDYTVNATLGLPWVTGPEDSREVVNHMLPAWDVITGQMIATGLLAAERHRRRTGMGQHVKLALEDVGLAVMGHLGYIAEAQLGKPRPRVGNYLFGAFGRDFLCADGERVMIVAITLKQWRSLCTATGLEAQLTALAERLGCDFSKEGERYLARQEIAALVGAWVARQAYPDLEQAFNTHGVCWQRYQTLQELVSCTPACSEANPLFKTIHQPDVGDILVPGLALDFSAVPRLPVLPAPRLGQHTEQVLSELLGVNASQFGKLCDQGVVLKPPAV